MAGKTEHPGAKRAVKPDRQARLKAALKANMAKRKEQARKRAASGRTAPDGSEA